MTCSYEFELKAVYECLRVVIRRQREGAALPGMVIFTDCRALVQALGGSGSESIGGAVLLADYLQKIERTIHTPTSAISGKIYPFIPFTSHADLPAPSTSRADPPALSTSQADPPAPQQAKLIHQLSQLAKLTHQPVN
ncbi:hypothetical protein PoB_006061700 [Plakobranchus ocellatus]|uniref:Reverse transcriptase RNase H-like domain-containing protein n=1 Tax=Plakobranchus ocellatus TaxID=259542 RepID=A0AAV4CQE8_9GAST|nr:hypothetical protein PoB_006061700 [Plakobranchus ocellatus]